MRHTISALVKNHSGVLSHIAGMFSRRAFNIDSLTVGETIDPNVSRMTIVVRGDDNIIEQVEKQLAKLIDVITLEDVSPGKAIIRELVLVTIKITDKTRTPVIELAGIFNAQALDMTQDSITFEIIGDDRKIQSFLDLLQKYGEINIARTGLTALPLSSI